MNQVVEMIIMLKQQLPTAVPSFNNTFFGPHLNEMDVFSSHALAPRKNIVYDDNIEYI
ncbi:MAG TPA: hypothetical protein VJ551_01565 [Nitrososphaeraceae archaeon]|nr:hypothetical protein [Nitrososphaeraceae archaeon]